MHLPAEHCKVGGLGGAAEKLNITAYKLMMAISNDAGSQESRSNAKAAKSGIHVVKSTLTRSLSHSIHFNDISLISEDFICLRHVPGLPCKAY